MKNTRTSGLFGALTTVFVVFAITFIGTSNSLAQKQEEKPEKRTWTTKDGKHTVVAQLVEHSPVDVTLKLKNGTNKQIKLSIMSDEDIKYLKGFPKLVGQADRKNLPQIRFETKPKTKKSGSRESGFEQTERFLEVTVTNKSKEKLDVEILQGFLLDDLLKDGSRKRAPDAAALHGSGFSTKRLTFDPEKETTFQTDPVFAMSVNGNGKKSDSQGTFIVQIYWKGQLLHGWAAGSKLRDFAEDPTVLQQFRDGL